jgi:beta-xylosidase
MDLQRRRAVRAALLLATLALTMGGCGAISGLTGGGKYTFPEPVTEQVADPFVLTASDGNYYMYGTNTRPGSSLGFPVLKSTDLQHWTSEGKAYTYNPDGWAIKDFWAPEVLEHNGHFYMFYTARDRESDMMKVGVAKADSPEGPFIDMTNRPMLDVDYATIDSSPFVDDDGRIYMYYVKDVSENIVDGIHRSDIYVVELNEDMQPISDPVYLISPTQEWESSDLEPGWMWNEGPSVVKVDGTYYMTYSGNPFWAFEYAIGLATSDSPMGPFEKYENNPVVAGDLDQGISGPGHNSIFRSQDGTKYFIAYHTHIDPDARGGERNVRISQVEFKDGTMRLVN